MDIPQHSSGADEQALGYLDLVVLTHVRDPGWIDEFAIMGQGAHTKGEKRSEVWGQSLGGPNMTSSGREVSQGIAAVSWRQMSEEEQFFK